MQTNPGILQKTTRWSQTQIFNVLRGKANIIKAMLTKLITSNA